MNSHLKFTLIAGGVIAANLTSYVPAKADVYALVLPEQLPDFDSLSLQLGPLLKDKVGPGDALVIYDGFDRKLVSEITFPAASHFRHFPIRRKFARQGLVKAARYLDEHSQRKTGSDDVPVTMRAQFFNEFADNISTLFPGQKFHVLLSGRSLENDPRQPEYAMRDQKYPNDAHFRVTSFASRFGTIDRDGAQDGITYHFCATDKGFESELHQKTVARVWAVFVARQGGSLATFTNDAEVCFQRFMRASSTTYATPLNLSATELEMLTVGDHPVTATVQPVPVPEPAAPAPVQPAPAPPAPVLQANSGDEFITSEVSINQEGALNTVAIAKIGIRWFRDCHPCDLDLHVTPKAGAESLYFGRKSTPEGQFHKDWTSSPDGTLAFEYIDITQKLDVRDYEIAINFYAGDFATGPRGVIRIWLEGEAGVFEMPFHIPAGTGNKGENFPTARQWIVIDPAEMLAGQGGVSQ